MQRLLLFILFMGIGVGLVFLLTVRESRVVEPEVVAIPLNVLTMRKITYRQQRGNRVQWRIKAEKAVYRERTQTTDLEQVHFTLYDAKGGAKRKVSLEGKAGKARLVRNRGNLVLFNSVWVRDGEGTEIRSDTMEYREKGERVIAPGKVWVKSGEAIHEGKGLVYDIPARKITLGAPLFYQ